MMKHLYDIVEGILDDQDEVMDKMTDDLIFKEIRDFLCSDFWLFPDPTKKHFMVRLNTPSVRMLKVVTLIQ